MKYAEVADNVKTLVKTLPGDDFIYELLLACGKPKASISRLKNGSYNHAKNPGEVLWKKTVWFKPLEGDLYAAIEAMKSAKIARQQNPRFLIVSDGERMLAIDRKNQDTLDIAIPELESYFDFFLPWAGMEKIRRSNENPADIKAAEKMAKLFDIIKKDNPDYVRENPHWMNIFLSRLLFCLFAEDTGIFPENAFCNTIESYTAVDGSDLDEFFTKLFALLDCEDRKNHPAHFAVFPYVNGGLFKDHYHVPKFSAQARRMIIESGTLNWAEINPDIFGSMFQAVIAPEERHNLGQHYTSVTNIMKVIEPLFLNDFKEELERIKNLTKKSVRDKALHYFHDRLAKVKIFDPACGSGNFLIIAYKELRKLEMELFNVMNAFPVSNISVDQFYGIEISDFACETAILGLWLAEHQMNMEHESIFGKSLLSLPLKKGANVVCANACRIDWESVCPKNEGDEIYILGNPPYLGSSLQHEEQKTDMTSVFAGIKNYKNLDYIACWFFKGVKYIQGINAKYAFVSTNSISQGEQVEMLWPHILKKGLQIFFAHQSFKWSNNAKGSAGVTCVIIGIRNHKNEDCLISRNGISQKANLINAYLTAGSNVIIRKRSVPLSALPKMSYGNKPVDGGNLIFSSLEKEHILKEYPNAAKYIKKLLGASEFIKGTPRWCFWISDKEAEEAAKIKPIKDRIGKVREMRLTSKDKAAREMAVTAHRFREQKQAMNSTIIIPAHTSENREYIPFGILDPSIVVTNAVQVIYDPETWVFGVLSSKMHMVWVRATCGMLETRIRYSSALCYNTFPIPELTEDLEKTITTHVMNVLDEREKHPEKTMAQLYDPDKMPEGLREAHHLLDLAVDRCYRSKPFESDEERLEHLFKLYEEMIGKEKLLMKTNKPKG